MTVGIYKLIFNSLEDWPYVGQSSNIEQRYIGHCSELRTGKSNFKLLEAFRLGGIPKLEILEECSIEELTTREVYWIKKLDTVFNGLNLTDKCVNSGLGENNFKSLYSNEIIEKAFLYLVDNPDKNLKQISKYTGVNYSVIGSISRGYSHMWLKEKYPIEYEKIRSSPRRGLNNASYQNLNYPAVISPDNVVYYISNLQKFCREHNLNASCMHGLLHGSRKTHKKWKLA